MKRRPENYVTLEFLSRSSNEGFARLAAAAFAAQLDPTLDELGDIKTAVSEAVTNAIVHAYPNQLGKIVMKLRLLENQTLELVIRDWGCGMEDVEQARLDGNSMAAVIFQLQGHLFPTNIVIGIIRTEGVITNSTDAQIVPSQHAVEHRAVQVKTIPG